MVWMVSKVLIAAGLISFTSWLAGKKPALAGFLIALPLTSMIAIALTQIEHRSDAKTVEFARSILIAVPLSLTFFLPFLFADRLRLPVWMLYGIGLLLLIGAYALHRAVTR